MKKYILLLVLLGALIQTYSNIFPGYIENKGQIIDQYGNLNPQVKYFFTVGNIRIQLRENGFSYEIIRSDKIPDTNPSHVDHYIQTIHRIDIDWMGSNPGIEMEKSGKSTDYINYYTTGTAESGVTDVHYYSKVLYKNVYDKIDVEFMIENGTPKYNIILRPGADISQVRLKINGSDDIQVVDNRLIIHTSLGELEDNIPYSYQSNSSQNIEVSYTSLGENTFGLQIIDQYDPNLTLIIDPIPAIEWFTYYGGSSSDVNRDVIEASVDRILVTGYTGSNTNIATSGAHQTSLSASYDATLMKFDTSGTRIWATYYGGGSDDYAFSLDQNSSGDIYIVGQTGSNSNIANGGYDNSYGGGSYDAFVVKFTSGGTRTWGTYFGAANQDLGYGIAVDGNDDIIITGWVDGGYTSGTITTTGTHQAAAAGNYEAFVAKFDGSSSLLWGTYYGGSGADRSNQVAVDDNDNIYIAGETSSSSGIAYNNCHVCSYQGSGEYDAFLAKFDPNGDMVWGTYAGGSAEDRAFGVEFDHYESIVITGVTQSNAGFSTSGAYQTSNSGGGGDGFICRFNVNGSIDWKTYFGGTGYDRAYRHSIDALGNIYASGQTASNSNIAQNGFQNTYGTNNDAFMALFDSSGTVQWASYLGNSSSDDCWDICVQGNGYPARPIYMVGASNSTGLATSGAHQTTNGSNGDGYITKIRWTSPLPVNLANFSAECNNTQVLFAWTSLLEVNNAYYTLEKSEDLMVWKEVIRIEGAGNSNITNEYNFALSLDHLTQDEKYFRLLQTDFDGNTKIYSPLSINCSSNHYPELLIYPNPTADFITIQTPDEIDRIEIVDINGMVVRFADILGNVTRLDLYNLATGIYTIRTYGDNGINIYKIIKF